MRTAWWPPSSTWWALPITPRSSFAANSFGAQACASGLAFPRCRPQIAAMEQFHGTTIVSVRRKTPAGDQVAISGDGQVTLGNVVIKGTARKVRRLYNGKVLAGFAGATADAFTLFERFEAKLEKHQGQLARAAIELTKDWRT